MGKINLIVLSGLLFSGCAEYLPISGGKIEGVVSPVPEQWDQVADDKIIQLETNAGEAYSVNLWVVKVSEDLYVYAGDNRANWVKDIEQNPSVRLRAGTSIYELKAVRVIDGQEYELFPKLGRQNIATDPEMKILKKLILIV